MAAVAGSLEEEALKRKERLKALRKKSGMPAEDTLEVEHSKYSAIWFIYLGIVVVLDR